jgi:hypothetical protein
MLRSVSMLPLMSAATCGLESQKTMPIAGSGRQKHVRRKMKFCRRANSNDNAIRAESLLKTDSWKLASGRPYQILFWVRTAST